LRAWCMERVFALLQIKLYVAHGHQQGNSQSSPNGTQSNIATRWEVSQTRV